MREISALTLAALLLSVSLKIAEHNHFDLQTRQFLKDDDQDPARFENKWLHSKGTGIREQTIAVDSPGIPGLNAFENRTTDEQAIRRSLLAFEAARNALDAKAVAGLFTPDGEFTMPIGTTYQGRPAIEKFFAALFQSPEMKTSRATRTVQRLRFLGPDVAIADVTGQQSTRVETIRVLEVSVMVRQSENWLIASVYHMHLVQGHSNVGQTKH